MRGGLRVPGAADGGSLFWFPTSAPPADPLRLTGGFLLSSQERTGVVGFERLSFWR